MSSTIYCAQCGTFAPLYGVERRTKNDCGNCVGRHLSHQERQRRAERRSDRLAHLTMYSFAAVSVAVAVKPLVLQ